MYFLSFDYIRICTYVSSSVITNKHAKLTKTTLSYVCTYYMYVYTWIHKFTMLFIEVSLAPDCFDTEDTQVDPITAVVVLVVVIVAVAVVVVTLMAGVSFDPFSIMICKQSVMQISS